MLEKDPSRRMSLEELMNHRFLSEQGPKKFTVSRDKVSTQSSFSSINRDDFFDDE